MGEGRAAGLMRMHEKSAAPLALNHTKIGVHRNLLLQHERHGLTIRARVSELRERREKQEDLAVEKAVEMAAISRAWVLQELRENADRAKKRGQGAVVNRALELIGREIGMFADQPQKKIGLDDLGLEALEALAAELESDPEVIAGMAEQTALALAPPSPRRTRK